MADKLERFVTKLQQTHGDNLKSVVLYGSAALQENQASNLPRNILIVLDRIGTTDLKAAHEVAEEWHRQGNPFPVYFTEREIRDSADVFPIEFLDMSRIRLVMWGEDPFAALTVHTHNLRHQLEYEMRGKLIRLRTLYIAVSHDPKRLAALMADSSNSFAVLFRHILPLMGAEVPAEKHEAVVALSKSLHLEEWVFRRIFEYERNEEVWIESETNKTFAVYLEQLERIIERVNEVQQDTGNRIQDTV
jgi:hypothetical protein